jgi:hypothetical protein
MGASGLSEFPTNMSKTAIVRAYSDKELIKESESLVKIQLHIK